MVIDIVYIFVLIAAAFQCIRSGYHLRLPLFALSMLASIAFEFAYQPFAKEWLLDWYPSLALPLLFIRILATGEAFWLHARRFPYRWKLAAATGFLALFVTLIVAWRSNAQDILHGAIQLRRVAMVGLSAFLGIYVLLMWSLGKWRDCFASIHLFLLFLLCLAMSTTSILRMVYPVGIFYAVNTIVYGMASTIYLGWAALFSLPRPAVR